MPEPLVGVLMYFLRKEIEEKLKFPLFMEDYLSRFKRIPKSVSVLMMFSENDSMVRKD